MGAPSKPASRPAHGPNLASEAPTAEQSDRGAAGASVRRDTRSERPRGGLPRSPSVATVGQRREPAAGLAVLVRADPAMLAVGGLAVGGYFVGEGSRPSDGQIASKLSAAVSHQKAVDATAKTQALKTQRAQMRRLFVRRGKRLASRAYKKGYQTGNSAGYSAGQSAGYASGQDAGYKSGSLDGQGRCHADGQLDGFIEGFDTAVPGAVVVHGHLTRCAVGRAVDRGG